MEHISLMNLVETTADNLKHMLLEGMDESEWAKDDIPALYLDVRDNLDKIYAIPQPYPYTIEDSPDVYLVCLKDGRKLLVDSNEPEYHADISSMSILNKGIKGVDVDDPSYDIVVPKGSLVYDLCSDGDTLVAMSPNLKQGISTGGSVYKAIILGKDNSIFEYTFNDYDFRSIMEESNISEEKLLKYDFVVKAE